MSVRRWQWGFVAVVAALQGLTWAVAFPEGPSWRQVPLLIYVLFVSVALVLFVTMVLIPEAYAIRELENDDDAMENFFTIRERIALNDLREAVWDAGKVLPPERVTDYVFTVLHEMEDDGA